jgi:putative flippase GtrA
MTKNLFNYTVIGVLNTIIGYMIIFYLIYIKVLPEIANIVGYIVGFILSYILNKKYNFKSKNTHKKDFPKFILTMSIAYILNFITLIFFFRMLDYNIYLSQIISGIVYLITGFILSKFYTFKNKGLS